MNDTLKECPFCGGEESYGASYRRDLGAWVLYRGQGERIGQIDGKDSALVDRILTALRTGEATDV